MAMVESEWRDNACFLQPTCATAREAAARATNSATILERFGAPNAFASCSVTSPAHRPICPKSPPGSCPAAYTAHVHWCRAAPSKPPSE
eukprot:10080886-Alexandrium_andersonii.AAC.1